MIRPTARPPDHPGGRHMIGLDRARHLHRSRTPRTPIRSEVPSMEAKQWTVQIHITEEGDDTSARAVLSTKDDTQLTGVGHARRSPVDQPVPEIGDELAAARALADLADKLRTVTTEDIAQATGPTSW
ncbi:dsRBD fold-containing protein [Streptosporangium sp. NBC_01755]|uniref:dsRBD fold-containing protein n=1 Tax=Streptosporangium sp. NBC_01755 TaxID=2975949 RepID=UPI003FA358FB